MKPVTKKKKAFTLTELLVVVVVIGVLSAVVLPKFNKVMETRKTTEAEEMMAAVRTEQEKRCALDKNYLQDLSKMSDIIPNTDTKNFTYVATATGIKAHSKGKYGYTLQMPSYQDGRLCCDDADCAKLNKDYPSCSSLRSRADYLSGAECQGEDTDEDTDVKDCTGPRPSNTQSCSNGCGTQTRTVTCNTSTGVWETGAWSGDCSCECTGTKPTETQSCNSCGTQTRSVNCDTSTGEWVPGAWSQCSKTQQECDEENKEEEEDCCAAGVTDFAACILEKYGDNSTEYICASGKNIGYLPGIGSLSGASACANKLMGFGCILRAANNTCEAGDKSCNQLRQNNINWISGGFKKYACTGQKPVVPPSGSGDDSEDQGGDSDKGKFTCCKMTSQPRKYYNYGMGGSFSQCVADAANRCPSNVRPGTYMNGSKGGYACVYAANCPNEPVVGGGPFIQGYVDKIMCSGSYTCTADQVVWP